jgi:drug/metabolite transporter superfamily protein YnfA
MEFLRDLWQFISERRKWWLLPAVLILLLLGALLIFAESSAVGSFIYTLF